MLLLAIGVRRSVDAPAGDDARVPRDTGHLRKAGAAIEPRLGGEPRCEHPTVVFSSSACGCCWEPFRQPRRSSAARPTGPTTRTSAQWIFVLPALRSSVRAC